MKKAFVCLCLLIMGMVLAACSSSVNGANKEELKKADQAAYNFIVAQVEGDHKLFKKVLIKDAQGILEAGRHANPGFEKEVGERYQIKRYSRHFDENKLYYYLRFYRPNHGEDDYMNVLLVKDDDGNWKSTDIRGIDESEMKKAMGDEEPVTVHKYKGDGADE